MKCEAILVVFVILAVLEVSSADSEFPICGPNEVWTSCRSRCPRNCYNYKDPPICIHLPCEEGCSCKQGYVLHQGTCIPESDCEDFNPGSECPANKTFTSSPTTIITCDNINLKPKSAGCYCKPGYVYNRFTGRCCLRQDCPKVQRCARHEEFSACRTPCPKTCSNINPPICYPFRCDPGCVCTWPYIRNEATGLCVHPTNCPAPVCRDENNEELKTCGRKCQPTCSNPNPICTNECDTNCFCKSGYIREYEGGRCIPVDVCFDTRDSSIE